MPDLVHYESQVKKARRASSHASNAFALADEGEDVRISGPSEKRKKVADDEEDGVDPDEQKTTKKRRISDVAGAKKGKSKAGEDDDMDVDQSYVVLKYLLGFVTY